MDEETTKRYFDLKYEMYEAFQRVSALRKELKKFDTNLMVNHVSHQPGNLLPIAQNVVVTHEVVRTPTPINQTNLFSLLLKFWRDVDRDKTEEQVIEKAQQQFNILLSYREYEEEHVLKVRKVPDIAKLIEQRIMRDTLKSTKRPRDENTSIIPDHEPQ
jgi:hypothetical protein